MRGDQGRTLRELTDGEHVISCVKHFIGYSALQGGKDYRHLDFSRRELLETYLPPHRAAIDAGALAVMNAYTAFEGVPCNFNRYLLTDLLRGELGFKGQLITDWTTLRFSIDEGAATDLRDAAVRGLAAGVDMDMISRAFLELPESELENLRTLKRAGKKIVSVVFAGRPVLLNEVVWLSDAVLFAWYPGAMGGEALAEILSGEVRPGETRTVAFRLPRAAFAIYDANLASVVEPGDFTVFVGGDATTENGTTFRLE